jgi:hypothetical protein
MGKFDGGLKEGDLITAFHPGVWEVTEVERRYATEQDFYTTGFEATSGATKVGQEYNALIHYRQVLDGSFRPVENGPQLSCDLYYVADALLPDIKRMLEEQGSIARWPEVEKALEPWAPKAKKAAKKVPKVEETDEAV